MIIAFSDENDGYYQFDWDGISDLPEWTKRLTQTSVAPYVAPSQAQLDAQANAAADKAIAAMIPDAVSMLMDWAEGQATGPDKVTIKALNDLIKAEKAKKK